MGIGFQFDWLAEDDDALIGTEFRGVRNGKYFFDSSELEITSPIRNVLGFAAARLGSRGVLLSLKDRSVSTLTFQTGSWLLLPRPEAGLGPLELAPYGIEVVGLLRR